MSTDKVSAKATIQPSDVVQLLKSAMFCAISVDNLSMLIFVSTASNSIEIFGFINYNNTKNYVMWAIIFLAAAKKRIFTGNTSIGNTTGL